MDERQTEQVAESIWGRLKAFLTSHNEEKTMDRDKVIATLREAGCPLSEERLAELEDAELEALQAVHADEESEPEPNAEDGEAADALLRELESLKSEVAELREAAEPAVEERNRERADLVQRLADNERCPFDETELEAKDLGELQKLAQMAKVRNYAGRGGPRSTDTAELQFMPPKPYWEDDDGEES